MSRTTPSVARPLCVAGQPATALLTVRYAIECQRQRYEHHLATVDEVQAIAFLNSAFSLRVTLAAGPPEPTARLLVALAEAYTVRGPDIFNGPLSIETDNVAAARAAAALADGASLTLGARLGLQAALAAAYNEN